MNTHDYYQLIRAQECEIASDYVWVASFESRNGGISGRISEVARKTAAKMIVDRVARLATCEEARDERARLQAKRRRVNVPSHTSFIVASYAQPTENNG